MTFKDVRQSSAPSSFPKDALLGAVWWTMFPALILSVCLLAVWIGNLTSTLAVAICIYGVAAEIVACLFIAGVNWELTQCRHAFGHGHGSLRHLQRDSVTGLKLNHNRADEPIVFKFVRGLEAAHYHGANRDTIAALTQTLIGELEVWCDRIRSWARVLPSLGLLGTVLGIIVLSSEISAAATSHDADIAEAIRGALAGMSTALVTTFTGSLFGAIALSGLADHAERLIARLRDELEALGHLINFGEEWGNGCSTNWPKSLGHDLPDIFGPVDQSRGPADLGAVHVPRPGTVSVSKQRSSTGKKRG